MSEQDSRLEQYCILAYVFQKIGCRSRLRVKSTCWWQCWGKHCRDCFFINNLEHAQIIFMLQVLKIGCSCLKIFITCLHLELFYLGSSFPPWGKQWERRESQGEIGTRHLKAKIFLWDCCIIRKRTFSPTENGWLTLKHLGIVGYLCLLVRE